MTLNSFLSLLMILGVAVVTAGLILAFLSRLFRNGRIKGAGSAVQRRPAVFLFEDGMLTEPSEGALRLIRQNQLAGSDLAAIIGHLSRSFPDLADRIGGLGSEGSIRLAGIEAGDLVRIEAWERMLRIEVSDHRVRHDPIDMIERDAAEDELKTLRSIAEDAPQLIWKVDGAGHLVWANRAYLDLSDSLAPSAGEGDPLWPARPVFADLRPIADDSENAAQRAMVRPPRANEPLWFEVTTVRRGGCLVHFAVDATGIIAAENGRMTFVQTLTKTFAHLPIGLAIFDRERRLSLFNPALLDLTGLPVSFLSARPLVNSVLDRLHDMNMLPEPKNYPSWRDQVAALEAAAVQGKYCETWTLPSGQTYRVSGRPHPDGAVAFLFEDISDEVMLTRRFRSELETAQAVLDGMDEGIVVFSRAGTLTMTNTAYLRIWNIPVPQPTDQNGPCMQSDLPLADANIMDEMRRWQDASLPSLFWAKLGDQAGGLTERLAIRDAVARKGGGMLACRVEPLVGGGAAGRLSRDCSGRPGCRSG